MLDGILARIFYIFYNNCNFSLVRIETPSFARKMEYNCVLEDFNFGDNYSAEVIIF